MLNSTLRVAQSCHQLCGQPPLSRVFTQNPSQANCCGCAAQPLATLRPRLNPHSPRYCRRTTRRRDFVPWRFSTAGRQSTGLDHRCRRSKTCTKARITAAQPCCPLNPNERTRPSLRPNSAASNERGSFRRQAPASNTMRWAPHLPFSIRAALGFARTPTPLPSSDRNVIPARTKASCTALMDSSRAAALHSRPPPAAGLPSTASIA